MLAFHTYPVFFTFLYILYLPPTMSSFSSTTEVAPVAVPKRPVKRVLEPEPTELIIGNPNVMIIAMLGLPGVGKSTVGRILTDLLNSAEAGCATWIDQHEHQLHLSEETGNKRYKQAIRTALAQPSIRYIVLDKCHHTVFTRNDNVWRWGVPVVWLRFIHPKDTSTTVENAATLAKAQIHKRTGHLRIDRTNAAAAVGYVKRFWQRLNQEEMSKSLKVIDIPMGKPLPATVIKMVFTVVLGQTPPTPEAVLEAATASKAYEAGLVKATPPVRPEATKVAPSTGDAEDDDDTDGDYDEDSLAAEANTATFGLADPDHPVVPLAVSAW